MRLGLKVVIVLLGLLLVPFTLAVTVGDEIFLNGTYIEVGIDEAGFFGSDNAAPAGFHPVGRSQLGFVADIGKDGWNVGSPVQSGDYFLPGTHEEGFVVEWNTASEHTFTNAGGTSPVSMSTTNSLTETSSGTTQSVVWGGEAVNEDEKVKIIHTVSFDVDDAYFIVNTIATNTGSVALNSFEFMRTVDPDNDKDLSGGNYQTRNYIAYLPNSTNDRALVVAKGYTYANVVLGLGAIDSRARASPIASGITARDPDFPLDSPRTSCTSASPCVGDVAIPLAFRFGTLYPGQSVSADYAYILNENDLDLALGDLEAVSILQPMGTVSGSNVVFQATTNNVSGTDTIQFFVNGTSLGVDATPDFGGNFQTTFNSTLYPDGVLNIKVIANFSDDSSIQKLTTVVVDNAGAPISFVAPVSGQNFNGTKIPINISIDDEGNAPTKVVFYRETDSNGSMFLFEDTSEPFNSTFDVDDLSNGETVVIKAVAFDSSNQMTTASVSGRVYSGSSFYNIPLGVTIADSSSDVTINSGDTFSTEKSVRLKRNGVKFGEMRFNFHEGNIDLIHLSLDWVDDDSKKANVIDWSSVEAGENINRSNHSLYIENSWQNGAYVCPNANAISEVSTSCASKTSFSHSECVSGSEKSDMKCILDGDYYLISGLEGTGVGANGNAELVIYDSAEGSSLPNQTDINFFAEYTNATSGLHIAGATCNVTFDDNPGTWYDMTWNGTGTNVYNFTKTDGFASIGTHSWNVTCSQTGFTTLFVKDDIEIGVQNYGGTNSQTGRVNFTQAGAAGIILQEDSIAFGSGYFNSTCSTGYSILDSSSLFNAGEDGAYAAPGCWLNTTVLDVEDEGVSPVQDYHWIENNGTTVVSISASADKDGPDFICGRLEGGVCTVASANLSVKAAANETSACSLGLNSTYQLMGADGVNNTVPLCGMLHFADTKDDIKVYYKISIPSDIMSGFKTVAVTYIATAV